jgi:hypothetical protein
MIISLTIWGKQQDQMARFSPFLAMKGHMIVLGAVARNLFQDVSAIYQEYAAVYETLLQRKAMFSIGSVLPKMILKK